jgi:hypothetical protein
MPKKQQQQQQHGAMPAGGSLPSLALETVLAVIIIPV